MERDMRLRRLQKLFTVLGGIFMLMPNGFLWYWGNMAVYVLSYVALNLGITSGLNASLASSLFMITWVVAQVLCDFMSKLFGRRFILILGLVIIDIASIASYFAIQHSFMAFNFAFGALIGFGNGFSYGNTIHIVLGCADKDVGLMASLVQCAFPAGAILVTQITTWFINPRNKSPDFQFEKTVFFSQRDVIAKVPSMFLVFGCFCLVMQIIGLTLMQIGTYGAFKSPRLSEKTHLKDMENRPQTMTKDDSTDDYETSNIENNTEKDFTPKQVLKSLQFYILFILFFIAEIPFLLLINYYKLYGQVWIHDDHFLANLGTALACFSLSMRVFWGIAIDKLGVKNCMVLLLSSLAVIISWYCLTAIVNRWLYFIATLLYGGFGGAMYGCFMSAIAKSFGKSRIATNYGLVLTSSVVYNLMAPFVVESALTTIGWYMTFVSAGIMTSFSLILCVLKFKKN